MDHARATHAIRAHPVAIACQGRDSPAQNQPGIMITRPDAKPAPPRCAPGPDGWQGPGFPVRTDPRPKTPPCLAQTAG